MNQRIQELESRLSELESLVLQLIRHKVEPLYLSLDDAALMIGKSKLAVQKILRREAAKPHGHQIRRLRGAVHRKDFIRLIESRAKRFENKGNGALLRAALKGAS